MKMSTARAAFVALVLVALLQAAAAQPPAAMSPLVRNLITGAILRVSCDVTGGLPLEQWKTRLARMRNETAFEALVNVGKYQGGFPQAYWGSLGSKVFEDSLSGAALLAGKESARTAMKLAGAPDLLAGIVAGVCGGLAQTVVMSPTTMLLTTAATTREPTMTVLKRILKKEGVKGLYSRGSGAVAVRQISNWASRQGITDAVRGYLMPFKPKNIEGTWFFGELACGITGGILSCWNTPFEVARINKQSQSAMGNNSETFIQIIFRIIRTEGFKGLFRGVGPRMGQAVWTTVFMCVGPRLIAAWGTHPSVKDHPSVPEPLKRVASHLEEVVAHLDEHHELKHH
mmetsp:Transcript_19570/g.48033  ORF Transcript_19570/g.48033 Transcript_19570/m.48033 type:complete len:343 (-) Transcript_19570:220-1248(-)